MQGLCSNSYYIIIALVARGSACKAIVAGQVETVLYGLHLTKPPD